MTDQRQATPAEAYQEYFVPAIFDPLTSVVIDQAKPRPGERVVDIACGTGVVSRRAAALVGASGTVTGVDINPGMIAVAEDVPGPEDAAPVDYRTGDALALDVPDRSVDLVLCQQGLQFFPDRLAGAREMRRVLDDRGRAVLAVWRGLDHHPLYEALSRAELPHLTEFGVPVTWDDLAAPFSFGDPEELRELLVDAGFGDVELVQASITARFADPERFVERLEYAYAAVVPQFADDPALFDAYLDRISRDTTHIVASHRDGDRIAVPMHTTVAIARAT